MLSTQGHGYLLALAPVLIAGAVGVLLATLAMSAFAPARGLRHATGGSIEARGALLAIAFMVVFATQELVEGALISSHPHGLAALAECWMALPLALPIGALAALVLGSLDRADHLILAAALGEREALPRAPRVTAAPRSRGERRSALSCLTLVFGLARRGPPLPARV
jgi:hypothetical protein